MSEVTDSLEQAADCLDRDAAGLVDRAERLDPIECLLESVGIDDDGKVLVHERLFENDEVRDGASTFLGVIIGLLAAELGEV